MSFTPLHNERELLFLISQGDEKAFRKIFEHYWDKLFAQALHYLHSPVLAQDAVQDVFIKIWDKRIDLPQVSNFSGYLFIICRNVIINSLRKKIPEYHLDENSKMVVPENEPSPDREFDLKELNVIIRKAIDQLTPAQKRIFKMSREQGMPLKEIAEATGLSYNTVREHMTKSMGSIRRYLAQYPGHIGMLAVLFMKF